jgi:hypothetical protein
MIISNKIQISKYLHNLTGGKRDNISRRSLFTFIYNTPDVCYSCVTITGVPSDCQILRLEEVIAGTLDDIIPIVIG